MLSIDPKQTPTKNLHQYLLGSVAPRPIAFVSTVDEKGNNNLAPYSFFNAFSSKPPILVFSSNRRVRDNTTKDTLHNVISTKEAVINVVNFGIVRQMALASVEFPAGVSEFEKSGLTPVESELVKPFRVKESPVQMECIIDEVITLGKEGGAGHLIVCKVQKIHLDEKILDEDGYINPHKIDLMGRMGKSYYVRASGEAIYKIGIPKGKQVIGYQNLPLSARQSHILTANDLGRLAGLLEVPSETEIAGLKKDKELLGILNNPAPVEELHRRSHIELEKEELKKAAQLVWLAAQLK